MQAVTKRTRSAAAEEILSSACWRGSRVCAGDLYSQEYAKVLQQTLSTGISSRCSNSEPRHGITGNWGRRCWLTGAAANLP